MSRELLQQALDALEEAAAYTSSPSWSPSMTEECTAVAASIRAHLAQPPATSADYAMGYAEGFNDACKPAQPAPVPKPEPVAWLKTMYSGTRPMLEVDHLRKDTSIPVYAHPAAPVPAPAQPQAEPVAWRWLDQDGYETIQSVKPYHDAEPLYTHSASPVPVPLTDEQIRDIRIKLNHASAYCHGHGFDVALARAIEAAHGIAASPEVPK